MVELDLKVKFPHQRHMTSFIKMLAWMELCGNVGHCTDFVVVMDGDGSARPKFIFNDDEVQEQFDTLRKNYCECELRTIPNVKDVGSVDMGFGID